MAVGQDVEILVFESEAAKQDLKVLLSSSLSFVLLCFLLHQTLYCKRQQVSLLLVFNSG